MDKSTTQFGGDSSSSVEKSSSEMLPVVPVRKKRRVKRKKKEPIIMSFEEIDLPDVEKVILSPKTQIKFACVVGTHVTAEKPWKHIQKDAVELDITNEEEISDLILFKDKLLVYSEEELLVGYIPDETREYDEFYICLTPDAEIAVKEIIETIQLKQEERLNNSIFKTIGTWRTYGSEYEVNYMLYKNNRPLLEVEVETHYPLKSVKPYYKLRLVENVRDGYGEILCNAGTFNPIFKRRIDAAVQVAPKVILNDAQTTCTFPKHIWTQYEYKYQEIRKLHKEFHNNMKAFVTYKLSDIEDLLYVNTYINFYTDDYNGLVKDNLLEAKSNIELIKEYVSFQDPIVCKGQVISCIAWHPMWTGIVAIAYSMETPTIYLKSKPAYDEVERAIFGVIPVLIWSFNDTLKAKLFLETPREITALSFCPFDENILVGGAKNGSVVIWDIKNKLKNVEEEEILTDAQQKYRTYMHSLMKWMKNISDKKVVRTTVVSNLQYSHSSSVTSIQWCSPFREITKSGQLKEIPEGNERRSMQFQTASTDGSVLCWDIRIDPAATVTSVGRKKLRRLKKRPIGLTTDFSPLASLNRILKPLFKVFVPVPDKSRNLPLLTFNIRQTKTRYEQIDPDPNRKSKLTDRVYYKPVHVKPDSPLINEFLAGSAEGDLIKASWEGFGFNSGEAVNKDSAKLDFFIKFHDGPIQSVAASKFFSNLVLTVGGKIFALWIIGAINKPAIWRKCSCRYTYGSWGVHRPDLILLTRSDGYFEIWSLKIRSDRYQTLTPVSSGPLTGTFSHRLPLKYIILGVGDYNGSFRLFLISYKTTVIKKSGEASATYKFCLREVDRKVKFDKWQDAWLLKNKEWVEHRKQQEHILQEQKDEEIKMKNEELNAAKEDAVDSNKGKTSNLKHEPGKYTEWAENVWRIKEERRMNRVLLGKKALNVELLEKQQLPLLKSNEEKEKKRVKQAERLENIGKMFNTDVAMLFPEAVDKKPLPTPDPYCGGDPIDIKTKYYEVYINTEVSARKTVDQNPYSYEFSWQKTMKDAKERRKFLDGYYNRNEQELASTDKIPIEEKVSTEESSESSEG